MTSFGTPTTSPNSYHLGVSSSFNRSRRRSRFTKHKIISNYISSFNWLKKMLPMIMSTVDGSQTGQGIPASCWISSYCTRSLELNSTGRQLALTVFGPISAYISTPSLVLEFCVHKILQYYGVMHHNHNALHCITIKLLINKFKEYWIIIVIIIRSHLVDS